MNSANLRLDPTGRPPTTSEQTTETAFQGNFQGETVRLTFNPSSRIEDAAEELTFTIAEESEKSLARREIQSEEGQSRQLERIGKIEELAQLEEMQSKLPDLDAGKLARLRERLRQMAPHDGERTRREAEQFFPDPALQYGALQLLEQESDDPDWGRDLRNAQAILLKQRGSEVRAGFNISAVASEHAAPSLGDLQKLRADYREVTLSPPGITGLYGTLLEKYGKDGLTAGLRYLLSALAADLEADGPSIERPKLKAILSDLVRLETLSTLLENSDLLLARVRGRGLAAGYDSHRLMSDLLALMESQWLQPQQVEAMAIKAGMVGPRDTIRFLRELTSLVRQAPLSLYETADRRDRLLSTLQEAMDNAIAEE